MQNGFYSVTGAMVTQFNRLDQISNNLANLNTPGYKSQNEVIGDFMRLFEEKRDELPLENRTKEAAQFLNRSLNRVPRIAEVYSDFKMGPMIKTGNPFDVALGEENLFFAVETPAGIRLTRDGAFKLNDDGELVTRDGFPVLSKSYFKNHQPIRIPPEALNVNIDPTGRIEYMDQTAFELPVYLDELMVVRMDDLQELKPEGDNYFGTEKGRLEEKMRIVGETMQVHQFMLEKSNVNPIREMTALIETNRLVEMYQKAMNTQMDDLNNDAINKLASIRA
ncbi:flagellar hook-basal body protein [Hydrogenimonas cancrithermarum]|uniref:Flagellar basal body protein n=1 Tax=Hydrogenimonas cancrithermarum TaxID=2993563 RepID=A0ABM8FK61_9BACT|nr:flagellar hook-basal body protein [Hydrogenimonas cancrithermarum]BDY11689.1 flagellar basal body protein [Hydrogenimonas cancrithermarum]